MNPVHSLVQLLLWSCVLCLPREQEINKVANYIEMLQESTNYPTIFMLFGVDRSAPASTLKAVQARLLRECYTMKKGKPSRFGKDITATKAKLLVVNGFDILTDKKLREAYDWILDDAPAEFMQRFVTRNKKAAKPTFFMPSFFVIAIVFVGMAVVFDIAATLFAAPRPEPEPKQKKKHKRKAAPAAEAKRNTLADTRTYKLLASGASLFRRIKPAADDAQKKA